MAALADVRARQQALPPFECRMQRLGIVGPNDPTAARQRQRFHDAGELELGTHRCELAVQQHLAERGTRQPGGGEPASGLELADTGQEKQVGFASMSQDLSDCPNCIKYDRRTR